MEKIRQFLTGFLAGVSNAGGLIQSFASREVLIIKIQ
jgi:hypothetical protein